MTQPAAPLDYGQPDPAHRLIPPGLARSLSSILGPLIGLLVVVMIFGAWKPSRFLSQGNFANVLTNNYHYAVAAVGATFVIVTAGIDLSVGSTMALACVCCAMAIKGVAFPPREAGTTVMIGVSIALLVGMCVAARLLQAGRRSTDALLMALGAGGGAGLVISLAWLILAGHTVPSMPAWVGVLVGVAAGTLVGFLNGSLITALGLPPFIVTLATLEAIRGLVLYISGGTPVSPDPNSWSEGAIQSMQSLTRLHLGDLGGLPPNVWIALGVALVGAPLLHFTILGRYAYAIGSNERTARLCGVNVERYKTLCYVIAGATAGLAGVMMAAKFGGGQPAEFTGAELTVIAAVVIGGTSLFGGEGTVVGTLLGILMLGLLYSGCVIADISSFVQRIFIGGTIVLAAALDRFRHLRG
ncbi:MAG TPA: ABC transporter permease [Tepidisphaeraceae bacterium]|jgi:ribose/xylose/arabinose/galactoside ABC-type transport system permease subunit